MVQVRDFLAADSADTAVDLLRRHDEWYLSSVDATRTPFSLPEVAVEGDPAVKARFIERAYQGADQGFRYLYASYPLMKRFWEGEDSEVPVAALAQFVAGNPFLKFVEDVTGVAAGQPDGHLAKYGRGHFLNTHTDQRAPLNGRTRAIAFVLNLTRNWHADWGGVTTFWSEGIDSSRSYVPAFNSMLVFRVPVLHSVSMIVPFATESRLSLAGWLHVDTNQGAA